MMNNESIDLDALMNKKNISISNTKKKKSCVKRKQQKPRRNRKSAIKKEQKKINVEKKLEADSHTQPSVKEMVNKVEPDSIINLDINNLEEVDNIFEDAVDMGEESEPFSSENILPITNIEEVLDSINTDSDIKEDYQKYDPPIYEKDIDKYLIINNGTYKDQTGLEKEVLFEPSSQKTYVIVELLNTKQHIKVPFEFINYIEDEQDSEVAPFSSSNNYLNQYYTIPFLKLYGVSSNF